MDVTSLLNTAGSAPASKPPRTSASPAITDSGHTVPSSALPTPSPERALGPADCDRSPRQSPSLWGPRGYSLQLSLDSKPRSGSVFSYETADGRGETEGGSSLYNSSRNNSVCSAEVSASSAQSPRTVTSRPLLSPRSSRNTISNKLVIKSFVSPEQSDVEHGATDPRHSASGSHSSQSTYASSASRTHSRMSSVTTIGAMQTGKEVSLNHSRGSSLDYSANGQRPLQQKPTLRSGPGSMSTDEEEEFRLQSSENMAGKLHKRTMSAPDIAQCSVARMPRHSAQPIISETTSRPSMDLSAVDESRRGSAVTESGIVAAGGGPPPVKQQDQEAYCMFVKDCDTGSQLRKAISHLFGRNKACTLRIPKHVWVYYCRKHYQRIRYRNAKTYPLNQMELVKLQIMRLQAWSEDNRKQHNGAYIRMWTLSLRKREQSRIENGGAGPMDEAALNDARTAAGTAVPEWLIQRVASGYTTEEILDVAERLHKEIKDGLLAQVPEIEFLPDIVDADSGAASKSARNGRRQIRLSSGGSGSSSGSGIKTPKRKAPESLDFGRHDYYHHAVEETYDVVSPSGKRARVVRPVYGPGGPRPDSAQLPPLASALSYGGMQPPPPPPPGMVQQQPSSAPPRAPNVVPRIQPLEYRRGSSHYGGSSPPASYYQQPPPPQPSPHSARSDGSYALSNGHGHHGSGDYRYAGDMRAPPHPQQQQQQPQHGGQPLPPISAQLDGRFPRGGPSPEHHRGRPNHWRSASAYAPGDPRGLPMSGRPSSSGHDAPQHHYVPHPAGPPPPGYPVDRREYEAAQHHHHQGPPPHPHYGPEHEQGGYTYSWPRGHHGSHSLPAAVHGQVPPGHVPRHAAHPPGAPNGYAEESWGREGRVVYGGRP